MWKKAPGGVPGEAGLAPIPSAAGWPANSSPSHSFEKPRPDPRMHAVVFVIQIVIA